MTAPPGTDAVKRSLAALLGMGLILEETNVEEVRSYFMKLFALEKGSFFEGVDHASIRMSRATTFDRWCSRRPARSSITAT